MKRILISIFTLLLTIITASAQILYSDYSDPDVCKGKDGGYWLTASSFQCAPGLPILYSENLRDWTLVNYAHAPLRAVLLRQAKACPTAAVCGLRASGFMATHIIYIGAIPITEYG